MPPRSYHIELSCCLKGQIDIKLNDTDNDEPILKCKGCAALARLSCKTERICGSCFFTNPACVCIRKHKPAKTPRGFCPPQSVIHSLSALFSVVCIS